MSPAARCWARSLARTSQGQLAQALALAQQPFLERGLVQGEPGEEVALVEGRGLLQRRRRARLRALLEEHRVDGDRGRIEGHGLRVDPQGVHAGQGPADGGQRLAQARPGLGLAHVAPEQRGELVARVDLAWRQGEIGQEGLRLPRRQDQRWARVQPGAEATEEGQVQSGHCVGAAVRANLNTLFTLLFTAASTVTSRCPRYKRGGGGRAPGQ